MKLSHKDKAVVKARRLERAFKSKKWDPIPPGLIFLYYGWCRKAGISPDYRCSY